MAAPILGELTGFIGNYLYGPYWGTVYSAIGLTIGSWIAFMLARFLGEPLLEKVAKKEVFEKFDHFMEHKGLLVSFLLFLIPAYSGLSQRLFVLHNGRRPNSHGNIYNNIHSRTSLRHNYAFRYRSFRRQRKAYFFTVILSLGIAIFIVTYYYHDKLLAILKKK